MKIRGAVLESVGLARPYTESRPISIMELELEEPQSNEILVRMEVAGICHSDLSVVDGVRVRPVPMLLGHEASGIVEARGSNVTDIEVGQRVVMTFSPRCGECNGCKSEGRTSCSAGSKSNGLGELLSGGFRLKSGDRSIHHHLGVSGFSTHAVVDRSSVVPVSSDVPPTVAALLGCAVLTGGGALINVGKINGDTRVAVVGLGGVGLAGLLTARALGVKSITAVDISKSKLEIADRLGATKILTSGEFNPDDFKADVVLEAAGNARAIESAISLTAPGGITLLTGLTAPDAVAGFSPLKLVAESRTVVGSYLGSSVPSRDIPYFVELWRSGNFPVEKLVSGSITLEEINIGMERLAKGEALRQVIMFS